MQHPLTPPHTPQAAVAAPETPGQGLAPSNIEELARAMYNHPDPAVRANAETTLGTSIGDDVATLATVLMNTLDISTMAYAALRVPVAFKSRRDSLPPGQIQEIIGQIAHRAVTLAESGTAQQGGVNFLHLAACKLNKLVLEADQGISIVAAKAMELAPDGCDLSTPRAAAALRLLGTLVQTVNTYESSKSSTFMQFGPHRRASTSFRDKQLKQVFQFTLRHLARVSAQGGCSTEAAGAVVDLVRLIMTFDFMAIIVDETEEAYVTQYPSDWRDVLLHTRETLELIGAQHLALPPPLCIELLRAMIGLIGTRRSFFESDEQKTQWMFFFMSQIKAVERAQDNRLGTPVYCGVLAEAIQRFIPPHTYRDLRDVPNSGEFINFVAQFSLTMFRIPFGRGGSYTTTTLLLNFWARLSNSKKVHCSDEEKNHDIEGFIVPMAQAFVETRIGQADAELDEDAIESLQQQSEALPMMIGMCLGETLGGIATSARNLGVENIVSTPSTFVWLCAISAALIRGCFQHVRDDTVVHASSFLLLVVEAITAYHRVPSAHADSSVEQALVQCLSNIQHIFAPTRIPQHLQQVMDNVFGEKVKMFQFILTAVGSNMVSTRLDPRVIRQSIELVAETCRDMPSAQLATLGFDLPPVMSLPLSHSERTYKLRSPLATALYAVRLPDPFTERNFAEFMAPIDQMMRDSPQHASQPLFLAGWLRDLRGVVSAASHSQSAFGELVDWILERIEVFRAVAAARQPPVIVHSFMKFLLQLVTPAYPTGRVNVPSAGHNPAGIYLFQFIAAMLQDILVNSVSAGAELLPLLAQGHSPDGVWPLLVKPLYVAMEICRRCVVGEFCPFGAMQLYGDNKFDTTVCGLIEMLRHVPRRVYKDYQKAGVALTGVLRALVEAQATSPFSSMSSEHLTFLIAHTLSVVRDTEEKSPVLTNALHFLSFIGSVYPTVYKLRRGEALPPCPPTPSRAQRLVRETIARSLAEQTEMWDEIVLASMNVITMQERGLSPASSTVFPIFECDSDMWQRYAAYCVGQYPPEKRDPVTEALGRFSSDVTSSEKFFSNAVSFRMEIRQM